MKNNKNILDIIKSFTEEDYKDIAQELEKIEQQEREFFEGPRFKEILQQIRIELKTKPIIHDDPYQKILFGDVTDREFNWVFSCLFNERVSGLKPKNFAQEDDSYNEDFRVFDGMIFRMISGQGIGLDVRVYDLGSEK